MAVITAIKPQKNGKRVNVYLDGKFGFGLDLMNYMKLGLRVEQELDEKEIEEIVQKAEFAKTLEKVLSFAMLRPRSEREIASWFWRKKVHASLQGKLKKKLRKYELLDDAKFAEWWVDQRMRFRPRSRRELVSELRNKGIDSNLIKEVMASKKPDDLAVARGLLAKNAKKWEKLPKAERKRKMWEYLGRKGIGWQAVTKVCDEALAGKLEEEGEDDKEKAD